MSDTCHEHDLKTYYTHIAWASRPRTGLGFRNSAPVPALPVTGCVTLGELLNLPVPEASSVKYG